MQLDPTCSGLYCMRHSWSWACLIITLTWEQEYIARLLTPCTAQCCYGALQSNVLHRCHHTHNRSCHSAHDQTMVELNC